jgi:hypothetical protein
MNGSASQIYPHFRVWFWWRPEGLRPPASSDYRFRFRLPGLRLAVFLSFLMVCSRLAAAIIHSSDMAEGYHPRAIEECSRLAAIIHSSDYVHRELRAGVGGHQTCRHYIKRFVSRRVPRALALHSWQTSRHQFASQIGFGLSVVERHGRRPAVRF